MAANVKSFDGEASAALIQDESDYINLKTLDTYDAKSDEDFESALKDRCIVSLSYGATYTINKQLILSKSCVILGNGAVVYVTCSDSPAIIFSGACSHSHFDNFPSLVDQKHVVTDLTFIGNVNSGALVVFSNQKCTFLNCSFLNIFGSCLRSSAALTVRYCAFINCERAVCCDSDLVTVSQCTFKSCIVCVGSYAPYKVHDNICLACCKFLLSYSSGSQKNNLIL